MRDAALEGADGLVIVSMVPGQGDSVDLRISVRNLTPGSSFGYNMTSSAMVFKPTSLDPFQDAIGRAVRVVESFKRVPSGSAWQLDINRTGGRFDTSGNRRSGPSGAPPDSFRIRRPDQ